MSETGETPTTPSRAIFMRLLRMLRPYRAGIALGVFFLLLSLPAELFPAFVWRYVTDDIVLNQPSSPTLHKLFSFNDHISGRYALLISSVTWMFAVYVFGELFGTLDTWMLNRVAQKFILNLRSNVYRKLQSQSLSYLQNQRTGDLMSRAMNDVDELQLSSTLGS